MRYSKPITAALIYAAIGIAGCNRVESEKVAQTSDSVQSNNGNQTSADSNQESLEFEDMFDAIVKGTLPDASEQDERASGKVMEKLVTFDKSQNEAFLVFLEGKLNDPSPFVRMEAGFNVALIRCDLGQGEKNEDLIPLFVELLKHEDVMVRKMAMNDMDPVVRNSNLGDKLQPFVPVLSETLKEPFTTYQAIVYLGDMGAISKESIPAIQRAAERDNDKIIDQASEEAIRKIEGGDQ